jgi:hypothetical protein
LEGFWKRPYGRPIKGHQGKKQNPKKTFLVQIFPMFGFPDLHYLSGQPANTIDRTEDARPATEVSESDSESDHSAEGAKLFQIGVEMKGLPISKLKSRYEVNGYNESVANKIVYLIRWIPEDAVVKVSEGATDFSSLVKQEDDRDHSAWNEISQFDFLLISMQKFNRKETISSTVGLLPFKITQVINSDQHCLPYLYF